LLQLPKFLSFISFQSPSVLLPSIMASAAITGGAILRPLRLRPSSRLNPATPFSSPFARVPPLHSQFPSVALHNSSRTIRSPVVAAQSNFVKGLSLSLISLYLYPVSACGRGSSLMARQLFDKCPLLKGVNYCKKNSVELRYRKRYTFKTDRLNDIFPYFFQINVISVVQTAFRIGKDVIETGTNFVPVCIVL
jgi:hypothetical protein